jgi:hypothetical protein
MNCFQSITQYINSEQNSTGYNKNACHFFALKTAYEFMKKREGSKTTHESNIYFAVNLNKLYQNQDMYFDEIIKFTSLKQSDVCATSTELIETGQYPLDLLFPNTTYCTIILKNAKYFVVVHHDGTYYVRDCHEPFQYEFATRSDMINHLNKTYQLMESIIVDGFPIPEFSSIEYIVIDKPFIFELTGEKLNIETPIKMKDTNFGLQIEDMQYEHSEEDKIIINENNKNNIIEIKNDVPKNWDDEDEEEINNDNDDYEDMPELEAPM